MADWKNKEMPLKKELGAVGQWIKTYWQINQQLNPANLVMKATTSAVNAFTSPSPESKPNKAFEETAWWWNYQLDRKVSQQNNEQGQYNALNWTGHVAGIPEGPNVNLATPQQWKRLNWATPPDLSNLKSTSQPTNQPIQTTNVWWWTRTVQPAVSNTPVQTPEDLQAKATPDEFWYWHKPWETEQQENQQGDRPGMELDKDTGVLYWRASGSETTRIKTDSDPYSAEAVYMEGRQRNYQSLQGMDSYDIAVSVTSGYDPYGSQAMRDLRQYDPAKYQEIQWFINQINWQENVNSIATDGKLKTSEQTENATNTVNNSITSWVNQNSTDRNSSQVQGILTDKLANSPVASSATQEMLNINAQIAEIQEKMDNLPKEARKQFKGDVPQYIVDAYVTNRSQQYQSELNKLQSRYNSAIDLYKTELGQKQWEVEMQLKQAQFESDNNYRNWQMYNANRTFNLNAQQQYWNQDYMNRKLRYDSIKEINWESYIMDANGNRSRLSDDIAYQSYMGTVQSTMQNYMNAFPDGTKGGQCEQFTDAFTYQTTGLKMEGANGWETTAKEKKWYVNTWIPEVWNVAVFDYWILQNNGINYWHTMLVAWYDPNTWLVTLKGSNKSKKEWEYETVYTQVVPLSQLMSQKTFHWFWNPYKDKVEQSYEQSSQASIGWYDYYATQMQPIFAEAYKQASTEAERKAVDDAEDSYAIMNELVQGGYIDKMANSDLFNTLLAQISNGKFSDSDWNINFSKIADYARNKLKDEDIAYSMDRFHRLIEKKLRKESGAAISQSEWNSNFDMYLPAVGQSPEYRYKKLIALERDIVASQLPSNYRSSYVPLISWSSSNSTSGRKIRWY